MKQLSEMKEPLSLLLGKLLYGYSRPLSDYLGNIRRGYLIAIGRLILLPFSLFILKILCKAVFLITKLCRLFKVLRNDSITLFVRNLLYFRLKLDLCKF